MTDDLTPKQRALVAAFGFDKPEPDDPQEQQRQQETNQ